MTGRGWSAHAPRFGRWAAAAAAACAIVGLLSTAGEARTVSPSRALPPAKVGAGVYRALARHSRVRVIVALRGGDVGRTLSARRVDVRLLQGRVLRRLNRRDFRPAARWRATPALAGTVTRRGLRALTSSPLVLRVDRDAPLRADLMQSVPLIHADQVQALGITGKGVTVAVVDSGVDTDHPDLADDIVGQHCFATNPDGSSACPGGPDSAEDDNGHGTAVAGIITSNGAEGGKGVAPDAKIVAVKVLDKDGKFSSSIATISALDWIANDQPDVRVVNMSLGTTTLFAGDCDTARADTIAYTSIIGALRARGTTVFASAGNDASSTSMAAPACVSPAVAVGATYDANVGGLTWPSAGCTDATTSSDKIACFSNSDPALDLLAPGAVITAPAMGGGTEDFDGTSAAAPHAAGVAALLLQARPDLTPDQLVTDMEQHGIPITDARNGVTKDRVDAKAAYDALSGLQQSPPPTYLPGLTASFSDASGDSGGGADIGGLSISSSTDGILTFTVATPNRTSLGADESIDLDLNTDDNSSTGDAGADYSLAAFSSGDRQLFHWNGSSWQFVRPLTDTSYASGVLTFRISQNELGITGDFGAELQSFAGSTLLDRAPDSGTWPFPAYALSVTKTGAGSGNVVATPGLACGATCTAFFGRGQTVTVSAAGDTGSAFVEWGGACSGSGPCSVTMDGAKSVTARFELLRRVKLVKTGTGRGTVTSSPAGIACGAKCAFDFTDGTSVSLTAAAAAGSRFAGWRGACSGTAACSFVADGPKAVTASFADVAKPVATALAGAGKRGRAMSLRYRVRDNSGRATVDLTVTRGSRTLRRFHRGLGPATGAVAFVRWAVPTGIAPEQASLCVRAVDAAHHASARSCAPIRIS